MSGVLSRIMQSIYEMGSGFMCSGLLVGDNTDQRQAVTSKIYLIRGQKAMLDRDLAELYDVATGNLNKAVKRNLSRFPVDFMFQLTAKEYKDLIFQNGTSSWGGTRKLPLRFYGTRSCDAVECSE